MLERHFDIDYDVDVDLWNQRVLPGCFGFHHNTIYTARLQVQLNTQTRHWKS